MTAYTITKMTSNGNVVLNAQTACNIAFIIELIKHNINKDFVIEYFDTDLYKKQNIIIQSL